jgi:hypothetical protein
MIGTSPKHRSRCEGPVTYLFLIASSLLFALILAEGVLRLAPGVLSVELQQLVAADPGDRGIAHPYIGYLHKPNRTFTITGKDFRAAHHTDGLGFRNEWPWPDKAEIVAVGDSVTFGYGVEDEEAWPARVARKLPQRVINLGLIGAGPQQYLRLYETYGAKLRPRLLLVGFFARNDFWDADAFDRWLESGAAGNYLVWRDFGQPASTRLTLEQPAEHLVSALLWRLNLLGSESRVYNLLRYAPVRLKQRVFSATRTFQTKQGPRLELAVDQFRSAAEAIRSGDPIFQKTVDALSRLNTEATANGTKVLVVMQPSKEEVYLPLLGECDCDIGSPLRGKFEELGIAYLDLLPDFISRAENGEALFFEADGHPNRRGQALTGELVVAHLKRYPEQFGLSELSDEAPAP